MRRLTVLSRVHAGLVNALRKEAYSRTTFEIEPTSLVWNDADDEAVVLGLWQESRLISTLRMDVMESKALIEKKLETRWNYPVLLQLPAMILTRAATARDFQGQGLYAILQAQAIRTARDWNVRQILGTLTSNAPHHPFLEKAGFQMYRNPRGWDGPCKAEVPVSVAVLNVATHAQQAIALAGGNGDNAIVPLRLEGPFPAMRLVTRIK